MALKSQFLTPAVFWFWIIAKHVYVKFLMKLTRNYTITESTLMKRYINETWVALWTCSINRIVCLNEQLNCWLSGDLSIRYHVVWFQTPTPTTQFTWNGSSLFRIIVRSLYTCFNTYFTLNWVRNINKHRKTKI